MGEFLKMATAAAELGVSSRSVTRALQNAGVPLELKGRTLLVKKEDFLRFKEARRHYSGRGRPKDVEDTDLLIPDVSDEDAIGASRRGLSATTTTFLSKHGLSEAEIVALATFKVSGLGDRSLTGSEKAFVVLLKWALNAAERRGMTFEEYIYFLQEAEDGTVEDASFR